MLKIRPNTFSENENEKMKMDGWMAGWMDGWTGGRAGGRARGRTDGRSDRIGSDIVG